MATRLVPQLWQVLDANGNPGNGWKLYFYETGTSNLKDTYSDTALSVANANPVVCNSDGRPANGSGDPIDVWGVNKEDYKVILKDSSDNTILTEDPIDTISYNINSFGTRPAQHWGTTTNTADAYQIKPVPSITAYSSDLFFTFTPHLDNNAGCTFAVFEEGTISTYLSPLTMKKYDMNGAKTNLEDLDLQAGQTYIGRIDTTDVIVLNPDKPKFRNATINELLQINKVLNLQPISSTVASGILPYTAIYQQVAGEGAVADTITDISGGNNGDIMILVNSNAYDLDITHNGSKINLSTDKNLRMKNGDYLGLICIGSNIWVELFRSCIDDFRTGSGYDYLPNNKLRQYGTYTGAAHGPTVTFGIAFDSIDIVLGITKTTGDAFLALDSQSTTNFVASQYNSAGGAVTNDFNWFAIGTKAQ